MQQPSGGAARLRRQRAVHRGPRRRHRWHGLIGQGRVVDHEELLRVGFRMILQPGEHDVVGEASDGLEAVDRAGTTPPTWCLWMCNTPAVRADVRVSAQDPLPSRTSRAGEVVSWGEPMLAPADQPSRLLAWSAAVPEPARALPAVTERASQAYESGLVRAESRTTSDCSWIHPCCGSRTVPRSEVIAGPAVRGQAQAYRTMRARRTSSSTTPRP